MVIMVRSFFCGKWKFSKSFHVFEKEPKKWVSQFVSTFLKPFSIIRNKNEWLHIFRINFGGFVCVPLVAVSSTALPESFSLSCWGSSQLFVKCVSVCLLLFVAASVCLYCLQESICWPPARPSSLASDNQHPLASPLLLLLLYAGKASCPPLTLPHCSITDELKRLLRKLGLSAFLRLR